MKPATVKHSSDSNQGFHYIAMFLSLMSGLVKLYEVGKTQ